MVSTDRFSHSRNRAGEKAVAGQNCVTPLAAHLVTGNKLVSKEKKKRLNLAISSVVLPRIEMHEQKLTYSFENWLNQTVEIGFSSVFCYKWTENKLDSSIDDDAAFEVLRSGWCSRVANEHNLSPDKTKSLRHFQFCVHECGTFDVLCESCNLSVVKSNTKKPPFGRI